MRGIVILVFVAAVKVTDLSGSWDFVFNYNFDLNSTDFPKFNSTQAVPSAWDAAYGTGLQYSRGTGFYKKQLAIAATPTTNSTATQPTDEAVLERARKAKQAKHDKEKSLGDKKSPDDMDV